ncbi:MAG: hypothetical protein H0V92_08955 [Pseudonocardiales bacterium]|nr:hypothetical protein [Pseudonocardiales bacterium]
MRADLDPGHISQRLEVQAVELDAALQSACGAFLGGPEADGLAGFVADEYPAVDFLFGLASEGADQVVLEQVGSGVDQDVDRVAGAVEQLPPGVGGNRTA